ncbi:DUF1330 domain-containing protein [Vibrio coralliilyticus]|uniref:DUF1330 domain-containing protein n=1 Tax=Vibrio coralliilyticus TaxID=190893 RepID=UPI00148E2493|nr:DUF1330 domain-containing protein [Vibrio coralliilyticus]NOI27065.1 DUF1330 domain-containing protein [Vibrio coralliilyticus]NOI46644.1 DUF1330 domain-containing protein [Vibrio coralliilyticus]
MSAYYSVLEVTPTVQDWIPDYIGPANKLVTQYGGKYLARTDSHERLEGDATDPALRIIIQWPSRQAALDFMNDPEYVPHLEARTAGSVSHHALIEAKDDLA